MAAPLASLSLASAIRDWAYRIRLGNDTTAPLQVPERPALHLELQVKLDAKHHDTVTLQFFAHKLCSVAFYDTLITFACAAQYVERLQGIEGGLRVQPDWKLAG